MQLMTQMENYIQTISGANDISQGASSSMNSGYAIAQLMEASRTRIRQKSKFLDMMLQNAGQQYRSRVFQFYSAPRMFRLTNDDKSFSYFKMQVENYPDQDGIDKRVAKVTPYKRTEDGQYQQQSTQELMISGDFDVRVSTGSLLPFSRVENEQKLMQYFDRGIIDAEEVLKGTEYPNYTSVLERMQMKAQQAAEAEMQAQQAPAQA
jgi:hypothetical protein